jgi:hypothetical protein
MTLDRYSHANLEMQRLAAERLDQMIQAAETLAQDTEGEAGEL